jgi:hypothetical protein
MGVYLRQDGKPDILVVERGCKVMSNRKKGLLWPSWNL